MESYRDVYSCVISSWFADYGSNMLLEDVRRQLPLIDEEVQEFMRQYEVSRISPLNGLVVKLSRNQKTSMSSGV